MSNKQPIAVGVIAGNRYFWCSCGKSNKQPWCDGSHSGSEFSPLVYLATETKTLHVCACKKTGHPPYVMALINYCLVAVAMNTLKRGKPIKIASYQYSYQ